MTLHAAVYGDDGLQSFDDLDAAFDAEGETWVQLGDADRDTIRRCRERLGIHPLAIEDVVEEDTRPKVESYEGHTFVLLRTARLSEAEVAFEKEIRTEAIGLFVGPDWLVTLSTTDLDLLDPTGQRWAREADRLARRGSDFMAYRIVDAVVDEYFELLDTIEDQIEAVEERVLTEPDPSILEDLNAVRRDLLAFRKVAWPTREALSTLARGDVPHIADANEKYFRDVYDHLVQVVDLIETYRDLTIGSRDIYLNAVSQSTNEVMKTLTVVATIFIPLTFVVGVYGMNFDGGAVAMPELAWDYAYPATMLGMLLVGGLLMWHFRRQEWL